MTTPHKFLLPADTLLLALPQRELSRLILSDVHPALGPASGGTEIFIEVSLDVQKLCHVLVCS